MFLSSSVCSEVTSPENLVCFSEDRKHAVTQREERLLHISLLILTSFHFLSVTVTAGLTAVRPSMLPEFIFNKRRFGTTAPCFLRCIAEGETEGTPSDPLPSCLPHDSRTVITHDAACGLGRALFPRSFFSFCLLSLSLPFLSSLTHLSTFRYSETQRWSSRACCLATGRKPALCGGAGFM